MLFRSSKKYYYPNSIINIQNSILHIIENFSIWPLEVPKGKAFLNDKRPYMGVLLELNTSSPFVYDKYLERSFIPINFFCFFENLIPIN